MSFYNILKKIIDICGDETKGQKLVVIIKNTNQIYFNITEKYEKIDLSSMPINAISIEKIDNKYIINYDGANFVQKKIIVDLSDNIKYVPNMIKQFFKGESNINYKIINYIIYNLYKNINDVNDKLNENEKTLKEIYEKSSNMTYNSTRRSKYNDLKYKAERILSILGTTEIETHDHYEYDTSSKNTYYKDFGLNIINIGPYDNNPGGLYIYYDNKIVLEPDSYKEGRWIDLLEEIYNNKYKLNVETTSKNKDLETIMDSINKISKLIPKNAGVDSDITSKSRDIKNEINKELKNKNMKLEIYPYSYCDWYIPKYVIYKDGNVVFDGIYYSIVKTPSNDYNEYVYKNSNEYYQIHIDKFDNGNWLNDFKNGVNKGINNIENKKQDDYNSMIDKRLSLIRK